ncbi:hypothetical protein Ssi03_10190 [Sphaerisporangium siamense]|uniref:DUF4386 domain-containing protein n=1 Tax=Sphaerisporangium siamense TaxID=795645 RepID=A0A7W7DHV0_9ACTN|nr:hypothetical protein [Sphaerisporangium siamense]MBB4705588.1 hypothetical protein [Sphaerisporangium siamense]GII83029.1 hypothetical protein Ssi03_10190 [Sphaerisporangium siamense]
MNASLTMPRVRPGAVAFAVAGVLFLLYPLVRPYSDESSMAGAQAIGSPAWVAAHMFAMVGFILLTLGLLAVHLLLNRPGSLRALVVTMIGAGLTLPYYGAEDFALNVIAARAVRDGDPSLLQLVDEFRYQPVAVTTFAAGLLLLGVGTVMAAIAIWRSGTLPRWSAVPLAAAFALFIPQFFSTDALRIAHGALTMAGALWMAWTLWRARRA